MNGKRSPTAKLESQLTVPAMMKAAGRWGCWKNSPVRMNGMPPVGAEQGHKINHKDKGTGHAASIHLHLAGRHPFRKSRPCLGEGQLQECVESAHNSSKYASRLSDPAVHLNQRGLVPLVSKRLLNQAAGSHEMSTVGTGLIYKAGDIHWCAVSGRSWLPYSLGEKRETQRGYLTYSRVPSSGAAEPELRLGTRPPQVSTSPCSSLADRMDALTQVASHSSSRSPRDWPCGGSQPRSQPGSRTSLSGNVPGTEGGQLFILRTTMCDCGMLPALASWAPGAPYRACTHFQMSSGYHA